MSIPPDGNISIYLKHGIHWPSGWQSRNYFIKDEHGLYDTCSAGKINYYLDNKAYDSLSINNINALLLPFGNHFWDFENSHYYFPKDSTRSTMFNSTFWMGGLDENNNLRLAAETYRQSGMDYQTGPLSYNNDSTWIEEKTINDYYRFWKLDKTEVEYHVLHYNDPGYEPNEVILNWPAHGEESNYQSNYLAPFVDVDNDAIYNPWQGDYPLIRGDQNLFFIFNDQLNHTETGGGTIGVEIHGFAYGFNAPGKPYLNNTTFLSYKLFNRSQHTLIDTYVGFFVDEAIDYWHNGEQYVGSDISRGAFFNYFDPDFISTGNPQEYPIAQGAVFLGGPQINPDGIDNPAGECDNSINGVGFGDGIVDNERYGMTNYVSYNNHGGPNGNPNGAIEHYNYFQSIWKDGSPVLYGIDGHSSSGAYGPEANFMFPGLTDPCNWGTGGYPPNGPVNWTEADTGIVQGDDRSIGSMGPFTFEPGSIHFVDMAFVTAIGESNQQAIDNLMESIDSIRSYYMDDPDHFAYAWMGTDENIFSNLGLTIFPNPASDLIQFQFKPESNNASYIIYNSFGKEVKTGTLNRQTKLQKVSLVGLSKGLYILQVNDDLQTFSNKLLIK